MERKQLFRLGDSMIALFPKDALKVFEIDFATLWASASANQWAGSELNTQLSNAVNDNAYLSDKGSLLCVFSKTLSAEKITDAVVRWVVPGDGFITVKTLTVVANNATLSEKKITNSEAAAAENVLTGYVKAGAYSALVPADTYNQAWGKLEAGLNALQEVIFEQYLTVSLRSNVSIFENGVSTKPKLTISVKFNDKEVTPTSLVLKKAGTQVSTDTSAKSYTDETGIMTTTTYELTIEYQGVSKTASVTVRSYYAMYMGHNAKDSGLLETDVTAMTKQSIKASAAGNYTITGIQQGEYAWFCIPTEFAINKMTSSGFDVPLEAPVTVSVAGHDYKCYRTSSALAAGNMSVTIA